MHGFMTGRNNSVTVRGSVRNDPTLTLLFITLHPPVITELLCQNASLLAQSWRTGVWDECYCMWCKGRIMGNVRDRDYVSSMKDQRNAGEEEIEGRMNGGFNYDGFKILGSMR
ncbi:unnamed protein product [Leuciscus chuanchicus]